MLSRAVARAAGSSDRSRRCRVRLVREIAMLRDRHHWLPIGIGALGLVAVALLCALLVLWHQPGMSDALVVGLGVTLAVIALALTTLLIGEVNRGRFRAGGMIQK